MAVQGPQKQKRRPSCRPALVRDSFFALTAIGGDEKTGDPRPCTSARNDRVNCGTVSPLRSAPSRFRFRSMEKINESGHYLGEIMVHKASKMPGVVVLEEPHSTNQFDLCRFTLRNASREDRSYTLPELREPTPEEAKGFFDATRGKPGFELIHYNPH